MEVVEGVSIHRIGNTDKADLKLTVKGYFLYSHKW